MRQWTRIVSEYKIYNRIVKQQLANNNKSTDAPRMAPAGRARMLEHQHPPDYYDSKRSESRKTKHYANLNILNKGGRGGWWGVVSDREAIGPGHDHPPVRNRLKRVHILMMKMD